MQQHQHQRAARVALFQGLRGAHHEMLGFAAHWCESRGLAYDVFAEDDMGWSAFYAARFPGFPALPLAPAAFPERARAVGGYALVALLTDDDWSFPRAWEQLAGVLCVDHFHRVRRAPAPGIVARLCTRPFPSRPAADWALPCYPMVAPEAKRRALEAAGPAGLVRVACVGALVLKAGGAPALRAAFRGFEGLRFVVAARAADFERRPAEAASLRACPNVRCVQSLDAAGLVAELAGCHFLMCPAPADPGEAREYERHGMSGALPLALGCGCVPVLPAAWNLHYGLPVDACVLLPEGAGPRVELLPGAAQAMQPAVYRVLREMMARRDAAFNCALSRASAGLQGEAEAEA